MWGRCIGLFNHYNRLSADCGAEESITSLCVSVCLCVCWHSWQVSDRWESAADAVSFCASSVGTFNDNGSWCVPSRLCDSVRLCVQVFFLLKMEQLHLIFPQSMVFVCQWVIISGSLQNLDCGYIFITVLESRTSAKHLNNWRDFQEDIFIIMSYNNTEMI